MKLWSFCSVQTVTFHCADLRREPQGSSTWLGKRNFRVTNGHKLGIILNVLLYNYVCIAPQIQAKYHILTIYNSECSISTLENTTETSLLSRN